MAPPEERIFSILLARGEGLVSPQLRSSCGSQGLLEPLPPTFLIQRFSTLAAL